MEKKHGLKKNLGVMSAMSIVIGCVIGAGVFFKPYAIYQTTGGAPGMGMLAWIFGGVASILAALTFAEVAVLIPKTGGMVAYLGEVYNEKLGFLAGWMQTVIFYPAYLAGYGVTVGKELAGSDSPYVLPIAMAVIILLVAFNSLGSKTASGIQVVSTICKLIPLMLLMVFGFLLGSGDHPIFTPMVSETTNAGAALGSTLLAVLFAFEGWTNVGAIAGEMKRPGRDLPLAIVGGVSIIMAVYFVINMAYLWVLPADQLMNLESPASAVAMQIFGPTGGLLIKIGIIISVYLLAMKEQSLARCCKLLYGVLSERAANLVMRGTRRTDEIFSGFVRGKLLDSLIIGILCFIGGSILNLPYTPLVSVVVGVTNIIPFFGPFLGAIPSAFLILLVSPKQCLIFIIFVIVLQQFDGNILGPKILGSATGISSFWVVVTILLGGGFFGVLGMFLGVPVFACLQELVKHLIDRRLTQRNMPTEAYAYVGRDKRPPQETVPEKTEDSPKSE